MLFQGGLLNAEIFIKRPALVEVLSGFLLQQKLDGKFIKIADEDKLNDYMKEV